MNAHRRFGSVAPRFSSLTMGALLVTIGACSYDFEAFDPRLGTTATGGAGAAAGTGGQGGAAGQGGGGAEPCTPSATRPCYTGPEGTEDQGICHGGIATCNEQGTGYGPCEGEVLPIDEDCETMGDDDCDGQANEPDAQCSCVPGEAQACYEGPQDTLDVGACHAGQQICEPSGAAFGPCFSQWVPRAEDCGTVLNDDCDDETNEHCALWGRRYGATSTDYGWGLAVGSDDSVVLVGEIRGTVTVGTFTLTADTQGDVLVVKLDTNGAVLWAKRYGEAGTLQTGLGAAIDPSGNVLVVGTFAGVLDLGGGNTATSAGGLDVFVAKLDSAGNTVAIRSFGGVGEEVGSAVAATATDVVFTGSFTDTFTLGTSLTATEVGTEDGFVAQLDNATGDPEWALRFGSTGADEGVAVAIDAAGGVYVGGYFEESVDFGGGEIQDIGWSDAFVAKLDSTGGHEWSLGIGDEGNQRVRSIALHPSGGVVVAGRYHDTLGLPANTWTSAGNSDIFAARFDADGNNLWGASFGGLESENLNGVAIDEDGNVLLAGTMSGTIDFGTGEPLVGAGGDDWLHVALDPSGGGSVCPSLR